MKKTRVKFCEECEKRYDKEIKYCPECGSELIGRKVKTLVIDIVPDYRIILKLSLIKGKVTRNEMADIVGERKGGKASGNFYDVLEECKRMGIVYDDGKKITSFGSFPALRVDKGKWAEFVENHEKSKELKKYLKEASDEIY